MESYITPSRKFIVLFLCVVILFCFAFKPVPSHAIAVTTALATVVGAIMLSCGIVFRDEGGLLGAVEQFTDWVVTSAPSSYEGARDWIIEKGSEGDRIAGALAIPFVVYECVSSWVKMTFGSSPSGEVMIPATGFSGIRSYASMTEYEASMAPLGNITYYNSDYPKSDYMADNMLSLTLFDINLSLYRFNPYYVMLYGNNGYGFSVNLLPNSISTYYKAHYLSPDLVFTSIVKQGDVPLLVFTALMFQYNQSSLPSLVSHSSTNLYDLTISKDGASGTAQWDPVTKDVYVMLRGVRHDIVKTETDNLGEFMFKTVSSTLNPYIHATVMVDYYPDVGVFNPGAGVNEDDGVKIYVPTNVGSLIGAHPATVTQVTTNTPPNMNDAGKFRAPALIFQKFPFCIPYDIYTSFAMLSAEPVTPRWVIPFKFDSMGINHEIIIDFKDFDTLANITRWFLSAGMMLGLILITRKLIRG